jgi:hypothetical protein
VHKKNSRGRKKVVHATKRLLSKRKGKVEN